MELRNVVVNEALKAHQEAWRNGELTVHGKLAPDPHNNLKDRMLMEDKKNY
jgi:hypothetical protein